MVLNGVNVTMDELKTSLDNIVASSGDKPVNLFIRGDKDVSYGVIASAMDTAKTAGIERISLVAEVIEKNVSSPGES